MWTDCSYLYGCQWGKMSVDLVSPSWTNLDERRKGLYRSTIKKPNAFRFVWECVRRYSGRKQECVSLTTALYPLFYEKRQTLSIYGKHSQFLLISRDSCEVCPILKTYETQSVWYTLKRVANIFSRFYGSKLRKLRVHYVLSTEVFEEFGNT